DVNAGVISRVSSHKFGKLMGCVAHFDSKGEAFIIEHYNENEKKQGQDIFIRNNKLKNVRTYEDGKKCGVYSDFNSVGEIEEQGYYSCYDLIVIYN
ncbi:MAG: hypothetical protein AB8B53_13825, partial [Flavobacteriales bacterium]